VVAGRRPQPISIGKKGAAIALGPEIWLLTDRSTSGTFVARRVAPEELPYQIYKHLILPDNYKNPA
jgi:hypothetical protein